MQRITVLVVDDHPLFRQGIKHALKNADFDVIGEAATAEEALTLLLQVEPSVVLTDFNLPDQNGAELIRQIKRDHPTLGVVMLSVHQNDEYAFNALRSGAAAYYSKDVDPQTLINALRRVAQGEYLINDIIFEDPRVAARVLSQFRTLDNDASVEEGHPDIALFSPLSDREIEVLEQIARGDSNKQIAESLSISTQTVKNHISSILRKLSLNDRTQAVIYALKRGWIERPELHPDQERPSLTD